MSHWTSPADFFPLKISLTIRQSSFRNLRNDLEKLRHNSWRQRRPQKAGRSDEISSKDCEVFECSAVTFGHSVYKLYRCCFIEYLDVCIVDSIIELTPMDLMDLSFTNLEPIIFLDFQIICIRTNHVFFCLELPQHSTPHSHNIIASINKYADEKR